MSILDGMLKRSAEWAAMLDRLGKIEQNTVAILDKIDNDEPEPPPDDEHPEVQWEPYLDEINAKVEFVAGARYQLIAVWHTLNGQWEGVPEYARPYINVNGGGGETHAFALVYQKDGSPLVNKNVLLTWPGGEDGGVTWDDGSVNFFTPAKYYPDQGATGPYSVQPLNGDILRGAGLPYGQHVSIFGVWKERADYTPTEAEIEYAKQEVMAYVCWGDEPFRMIRAQKAEV